MINVGVITQLVHKLYKLKFLCYCFAIIEVIRGLSHDTQLGKKMELKKMNPNVPIFLNLYWGKWGVYFVNKHLMLIIDGNICNIFAILKPTGTNAVCFENKKITVLIKYFSVSIFLFLLFMYFILNITRKVVYVKHFPVNYLLLFC